MRLTHLLLACLLVGGLAAQSVNYRDTLEVEIGNGAKVVFLAQSAKDFEAIDRYDLNYVFEELWRRRQAGEQGLADLSRAELEQLQEGRPTLATTTDTEEFTVSKRRFYVALTTGITLGSELKAGSAPFFFADNPGREINYAIRGRFQPSTAYELSIGTDYVLRRKNDKEVLLKLALGWSSNAFRLKDNRFGYFFARTEDGGFLDFAELQEISNGKESIQYDRKLNMSLFFFQAVPSFDLLLDKQKRPLAVGVGPRIGLGVGDSGTERLGMELPIFDWGGTTINVVQPRMQYAVVTQLSYRSCHLFGHYYPRAYSTTTSTIVNTIKEGFSGTDTSNHGLWVLGLKTYL